MSQFKLNDVLVRPISVQHNYANWRLGGTEELKQEKAQSEID